MMGGEAYTWKTAYDENYARYSPGKLLMSELTEWHLDDANIVRSDSCAVSDHPIMSRFWQEREEMGTLVIGLTQNGDRDMRQVAPSSTCTAAPAIWRRCCAKRSCRSPGGVEASAFGCRPFPQ